MLRANSRACPLYRLALKRELTVSVRGKSFSALSDALTQESSKRRLRIIIYPQRPLADFMELGDAEWSGWNSTCITYHKVRSRLLQLHLDSVAGFRG